jgi:hypothetical protein
MILSNGRVNPNTKEQEHQRAPGMRSSPIANPAIVAIASETGTTVSTGAVAFGCVTGPRTRISVIATLARL